MEGEIFCSEIIARLAADLSFLRAEKGNEKKTYCLFINSNSYNSLLAVISSLEAAGRNIESIESKEMNHSLFTLSFRQNSESESLFTFFGEKSTGVQDIEQISRLAIELNLGFSMLESYLALYHLIPHALPQTTPMGYGKIVFQLASSDQRSSSQAISLSNATVWTSPGAISSIEYMISLIRLSHHHPAIFLSLAQKIRQKVSPSPPPLSLDSRQIEYLQRQEDQQTLSSHALLMDLSSLLHIIYNKTLSLLLVQITASSTPLAMTHRVWFRRIFNELCRIFLEMRSPETAVVFMIKVLKKYCVDEELFLTLAR
jgi:hypothetical protein